MSLNSSILYIHNSRLSLKQSSDKLWYFPHHLLDLRDCRIHTMRLIQSDILLPHLLSSGRVSTQTTHAHSHDILFQIRYTQLTTQKITEKEVRVSSYLIALVIQALSFHHIPANITGRMQREPAMTYFP